MKEALSEATNAAGMGEVPVGAVIVRGGVIIARGHNTREADRCADGHAEMAAIREASKYIGGWRLSGCTMYVTLEPCPMCAGAVINSRIDRVVIGVKDPNAGALGSVINLASYPLGSKPKITFGVCERECSAILRDFFAALRKKK